MRRSLIIYLFVTLWSIPLLSQEILPLRWVCYYSDKASNKDFAPYDICVLDSTHYPPLIPLKQDEKILMGYLSLGEVENYRFYFHDVKKQGILLKENPNWKGSFYVDVRNPLWAKRVVEDLVPKILQEGFDGIFLDTLDNAEFLEDTDPHTYKGMKEAAVNLVKAIRQNYPQIKIMMNRGFQILPKVVNVIDMELGEAIYSGYDFDKKNYKLQTREEYQEAVEILKEAQEQNPKLKVFTLDYWNKKDTQKIAEIYQQQRTDGFIPYVATIKLDEIIAEPKVKRAKTE